MRAYRFRVIPLYLIFAVGNVLFLTYTWPANFLHSDVVLSAVGEVLSVCGGIVFFLGLPVNFLAVSFLKLERSPGLAAFLWLGVAAPVFSALFYAWLIPLLFHLAKLVWRGIISLPEEPE